MAHAHAADAFDHDVCAGLLDALLQGLEQTVASLGHAAGTKADVNLRGGVAAGMLRFLAGRDRSLGLCLPRQKILDDARQFFGGHMAVGCLFHLQHRREGAAAQAGHRLDGELPVGIGVIAGRNAQPAAQGVFHPFSSGDVASRAPADAHDELADRLMPEHVVERRDAGEGGGCDLSRVAHAAQGFVRQIAVVLLQRLQNRNHRIGRASDPFHRLVGKGQVNVGHGSVEKPRLNAAEVESE